MPMPRIYLIPSETPNAFATGRNPEHAAVAVTEGILRILDRRQLELTGAARHQGRSPHPRPVDATRVDRD